MMNLLVFTLIGALAGAAARLLYPGRQPLHVLGTLALGAAGGLAGGMLSWGGWPDVDGQFQTANLVFSILGAFFVIAAWAGLSYARRLSGPAR